MKIIEGFELTKQALSRPVPAELYAAPTALKRKLKELFGTDEPEAAVRQIIDEVRQRGDTALFDYTLKIDQIKLTSLEVSQKQVEAAYQEVKTELVTALKLAADRIRIFHLAQKKRLRSGVTLPGLNQLIRPLEHVGVYAPGGTASYPSTVLMTAIPARVAGVKEIILMTPPKADGSVPSLTLTAAKIAGVDRIFSIGGAQAIAALAFGTESIPRVDRICGPGNIFVTLAKKLVYGVVGIDGLQGPSEVLLIADETADPADCAADLLAQSEHDAMASAILLTTSRQLAKQVNREVEHQVKDLPRKTIAAESLASQGIIGVVANIDKMIELANLYAPEHLCLMVDKADTYITRLTNAGCIITGKKATVAMGDYIAGPSHVLPTGGTARFSSPLNVTDFLKLTNVINVDESSLKELGQAAQTLARAEGFEAHERAITRRIESLR